VGQASRGRQAGSLPSHRTWPNVTSAKWIPKPIVSGSSNSATRRRRWSADWTGSWSKAEDHSGWIAGHVRKRAAALGLTAAQATALREMTGPMTMRELAQRMTCEPSNATFVIDKLEKQGLAERRAHPTDRRARHLVLTTEGGALREQLLELLAQDSPLAGLSPEQQRVLQGLLEQAIARP
jgi:DNA-binding MarR family transcriptional regulator